MPVPLMGAATRARVGAALLVVALVSAAACDDGPTLTLTPLPPSTTPPPMTTATTPPPTTPLRTTVTTATATGAGGTTVESTPGGTAAPSGGPGSAVTSTVDGVDDTVGRDFGAVDGIIDDFVVEAGLEGAGFVVVERDEGVVHEHYAGAFTSDRVSFVASSSKMVAAGVLMRLHDEGALDIDAPVADVVGWGAANPAITPAQLVSSSSGLVGLRATPPYDPYACQWSLVGTLQECAEQIFTTPDDDADVIAPDTAFRYGGGQWQVAGAVAEVASGRTWAELVEEIYVEPCGLEAFGFVNPFAHIARAGFAYPGWANGHLDVLDYTRNPNIEAGLYTTPRDYAALLLMHLRGGRCGDEQVLTAEGVERLHADRIGAVYGGSLGPGIGYGMGWKIDHDAGRLIDDGAYGAVPWIDPDDGYGAYLVVEATAAIGGSLAGQLYGPLEAIMTGG